MTIRTGTIDDYAAVCRLLREMDELHERIRPDVFGPCSRRARPREHIAQFIDGADGEIFLAETGAEMPEAEENAQREFQRYVVSVRRGRDKDQLDATIPKGLIGFCSGAARAAR